MNNGSSCPRLYLGVMCWQVCLVFERIEKLFHTTAMPSVLTDMSWAIILTCKLLEDQGLGSEVSF